MESAIGNFFGVIMIILLPIALILFFQFLSKLSGKNIKPKHGGSTITPDDFDNSIEYLDKLKNKLSFEIKTIGSSKFKRYVLKFENVLKSDGKYKYSDYLNKRDLFLKYVEKEEKHIAEQNRVLSGEKRTEPLNFFVDTSLTMKEKMKLSTLRREMVHYNSLFNEADVQKIVNFFSASLENDREQVLKFLDKLGCEYFKPICSYIKELEILFLKNDLTKEEVENIKNISLYYKGFLSNML
jgi:hypothetical protein